MVKTPYISVMLPMVTTLLPYRLSHYWQHGMRRKPCTTGLTSPCIHPHLRYLHPHHQKWLLGITDASRSLAHPCVLSLIHTHTLSSRSFYPLVPLLPQCAARIVHLVSHVEGVLTTSPKHLDTVGKFRQFLCDGYSFTCVFC